MPVRMHEIMIGQKKTMSGKLMVFLPLQHEDTDYARFTFSSILKTPLGDFTKRRLKALPKQRRSSVLRRVRLISAIDSSRKIKLLANPPF